MRNCFIACSTRGTSRMSPFYQRAESCSLVYSFQGEDVSE